jgi:basic membrane lipoprotein Med (substrate-binding protein (PBP1-ABC) superfamily)
MGAIAGSMAKNNKILYVADYPIYGTIAQINAFAIGAQMINPHVQIHLEWSSKKDFNLDELIERIQPDCISGKDMRALESDTYLYGISKLENGIARNLAMPLINWGTFYEKLVNQIMDGTWKLDEDYSDNKAINYWWGMSAGVVDVICSRKLPVATKRLVNVLKESICNGSFSVFEGELYSQDGVVQPDPEVKLKPEEVASIDWLAENIIGEIPETEGLTESAIPVVAQQGVKKKG